MATEENAAVVQRLFERFNEGDLDGAMALAAEDCELVDLPSGQRLQGPEGLRRWLAVFCTAGPDAHTELTNSLVAGDWVATEHVGRFTHTGPLPSPSGVIAPTGRTVELAFAEIYRLRSGRLVLLRAYYDLATLLRQLGLLPA